MFNGCYYNIVILIYDDFKSKGMLNDIIFMWFVGKVWYIFILDMVYYWIIKYWNLDLWFYKMFENDLFIIYVLFKMI